MSSVIVGDDGVARCAWSAGSTDYAAYHDREWGRPVHDDRRLFEKLSLEAFQSGLSWLTILRKRAAFREVFADFDIATIAGYDDADVERLMSDARIVRNRAKISAVIANARAADALISGGDTLEALLWGFAPTEPGLPPRTLADIPATTAESTAMARMLKKQGFRFVGPTTCYALMQAVGMVNDHVVDCAFRAPRSRPVARSTPTS